MWVVCKFKSGGGTQLDRYPNQFHDVSFHDNELDALRAANTTGGKAIKIVPGEKLDDLYFASYGNS
jgi:hypothetical protein